jgi:hypothetical protein
MYLTLQDLSSAHCRRVGITWQYHTSLVEEQLLFQKNRTEDCKEVITCSVADLHKNNADADPGKNLDADSRPY